MEIWSDWEEAMKKHKMCPKCLTHIVRYGAGPKEQCKVCSPGGKKDRLVDSVLASVLGRKP